MVCIVSGLVGFCGRIEKSAAYRPSANFETNIVSPLPEISLERGF
jgi:hypothetical protein